jgi:hypothetical protein
VPQKLSGYLVTVHPVITDDRVQVIDEATPPKEESTLATVIGWVVGLPLGLWLGHWIVGLWCHCY